MNDFSIQGTETGRFTSSKSNIIEIPKQETIKDILMRRDGMTEGEALDLIKQAKLDLEEGLLNGEPNYNICEKWFGLEPDYIDELLDIGI